MNVPFSWSVNGTKLLKIGWRFTDGFTQKFILKKMIFANKDFYILTLIFRYLRHKTSPVNDADSNSSFVIYVCLLLG